MNKIKKLTAFILSFLAFAVFAQQPLPAGGPAASSDLPVIDYGNPRKYILKDVRIEGANYMDPGLLINSIGLVKGDTVYLPSDYVSDAIRKLWSQRYYSNVRAEVEVEGDSAVIVVKVQERPRVLNWKIEGVKSGEANQLIKEKLKLRRGGELSDYVIDNAVDVIKKFFHEKAFLNTKVSIRQENDTTMKNMVNVTFVVDKGPKVKIGKITFEGNDNIPAKKLRGAMKGTKQKSINIFKSAKFNEKKFEEDKLKLIEYYNSKGYRDARILSDTIFPINDKRIRIHFKVDEGKKYYYRDISWIGNKKFPTDVLNQLLGIRKGAVYNRKDMEDKLGLSQEGMQNDYSIYSLYQNDGYIFSQIEPVETVVEGDSIDIQIRIIEGKQATVNEVKITGNTRTNERVARRELYTRPAELYNKSLLMRSLRQIGNIKSFNPEKVMPDLQPISNEAVDITFNLEETASDEFQLSGGWGGGTFVGSVGITFNNLSVRKLFDKKAWRPYPGGDNQSLSIKAQSNGSYYKSFSLSFLEPWLGGHKPNSLSISAYYSDETNAYYAWQKGTKHFMTIGAAVGLGKRLNWPDPYFNIYAELSYQAYKLKDWEYFLMNNGISNIFSLKFVLDRNSVDQPIYPRRGSDFSVSLAFTPPYSWFDKKNYADPNMTKQQKYRFIEYYKWNLKYQWYFPMLKNEKLVLMTKAEMGYLGHYSKYKQSPFEGFSMGGDGISGYNVYGVEDIGLRGYEENDLTPRADYGEYANVYTKYTAELRYPVILQPQSTVYALVFAEAGNAYSKWTDFNPFLLKRSLGFGLRLYLPIVGMLGIDWGYGFDKPYGSNKPHGGQFHFMIGQQF